MSLSAKYDDDFYIEITDGSQRSAAALVPVIRRLLPHAQSVIDFGCGAGAWLAELERSGFSCATGYDFGSGIPGNLLIDSERYRSVDLSQSIEAARHDLCMSLEVAEHIGAAHASTFVRNLCSCSDVVLFSAALPGQGGHHHLNERWPRYWIDRFEALQFKCFDVVRPLVWNDARICWWYRQNTMLFVRHGATDTEERLKNLASFGGAPLVHPELFEQERGVHLAVVPSSPSSPVGDSEQPREVYLLGRLVRSTFWKITFPLHWLSRASRRINRHYRKRRRGST